MPQCASYAFGPLRCDVDAMYNCKKCPGYCCSYPLIALDKRDVERLAKYFGLSFAKAKSKFTAQRWGRKYTMRRKADPHFGRICRFFLPVLRAQAQARRGLNLDLRRAFEQDEFELFFQPQIRLIDEAVVGAEALLRWRHPERGILAPGAFVETLAESAISSEVGRWIIRTACQKTAIGGRSVCRLCASRSTCSRRRRTARSSSPTSTPR